MKRSGKTSPGKENERTLASVAAAQAVKGHNFSIGSDGELHEVLHHAGDGESQEPYREIDGCPVFHACENRLEGEVEEFSVRKLYRWGCLDHPILIAASYEIGGEVKFYIDTRIPGLYLLWTSTRIDDQSEFPGVSYDLVAWTPRCKDDTIQKAGFRLAHAALLEMMFVPKSEWKDKPWFIDSESEGLRGTREVAMLLGSIYPTIHTSERALKLFTSTMPDYLKPLYISRAAIGDRKERFEY